MTLRKAMAVNPNVVAQILATESGKLLIAPVPGRDPVFGRFAEIRKQADGRYSLTPLDEWVPVQKVLRILDLSEGTLRRLLDVTTSTGAPILPSRRPSIHILQIHLNSVLAHEEACKDPEYWNKLKPKTKR